MTEEEISSPIIEPPYWIIVAGEKGDWTAKTYPFDRWQEVVSSLSNVKFVQIGAKEHKHPILNQPNVINLIGKTQDKDTGIRDLFRLFYFAEGSMGLVSFQMHLAAAFNLPCIVIAGAREPARFTRYPGHQYLCTDGCLPCASVSACWHCDLEKTCPSIVTGKTGQRYPKCVDLISSEDVLRAFHQYYDGGRLSFDHPRTPTLPNPISKNKIEENKAIELKMFPSKDSTKVSSEIKNNKEENFGFTWGGAHITKPDWEFLESILEKYKIKTVLEFGSGLSTLLIASKKINILSFETNERYLKQLRNKKVNEFVEIRLWNGKEIHDNLGKFDLAIVDGPPGGINREISTKIASEHSDLVLIHDAGRKYEKEWQSLYLEEKFEGPGKGGSRWHFWKRKLEEGLVIEKEEKIEIVDSSKPLFRIFCNSRGDGGCGRSIDFFMKAFINLEWRVEYVYSNSQPSGTHRRCGSPKVVATSNLDLIRAPCDVFMLATDDLVWDFPKPEVTELFSNINAKRKVMYINFRIGKIGELEWTQNWDNYLFLNSNLEEVFVSNYMKSKGFDKMYSFKTKVLPPPVDISDYLSIIPDYNSSMKIIRHSSQGDSKYATNFNEKIRVILENFPDATIRLMPGPSFIENFGERVICHKRNEPEVKEFLKLGNVFFYDLPRGYAEGGPRVLIEAMSAGLPCIATNNPGPRDRITKETGFLYDIFESALTMFKKLNIPEIRKEMGEAAKNHAIKEYDPKIWIDEIIGES
jgi:glycosyltransferase involved in cell wall biosynthesis